MINADKVFSLGEAQRVAVQIIQARILPTYFTVTMSASE
jgi:hypothetical protein